MGNSPSNGDNLESLEQQGLKGSNGVKNGKGDNSIAQLKNVELQDFSKFELKEVEDKNHKAERNTISNNGANADQKVKGGNSDGAQGVYRVVDSPTFEIHSDLGTPGSTTPPVIIELVTSSKFAVH